MLITFEYMNQNRMLHEQVPKYGISSWKEVEPVKRICRFYDTTDVLDYGCGKGELAKGLKFPIQSYDPALLKFAMRPGPADIVVCTDVMEHVEPGCLGEVLDDIYGLTRKAAYFVIATRLASKTLPDGRNTHLIVEGHLWWLDQLRAHRFTVVEHREGTKNEAVFTAEV